MRLALSDFVEGRQCFVIVKDTNSPWRGPHECRQLETLVGELGFWVRKTSDGYAHIVNSEQNRIAFTNYWEARAYVLKENMKCKK